MTIYDKLERNKVDFLQPLLILGGMFDGMSGDSEGFAWNSRAIGISGRKLKDFPNMAEMVLRFGLAKLVEKSRIGLMVSISSLSL